MVGMASSQTWLWAGFASGSRNAGEPATSGGRCSTTRSLTDLAAAERAVTAYAGYYNYHRLHGELGLQTPAERFDGTPFTDRGFESVPVLAGIADLLDELMAA